MQIRREFEKADNILLISHKRPDGDTLGSTIAFYFYLKSIGKKVTMACIDPVPDRFIFLPEVNKFVTEFNFTSFDLMVVSDAGASYMTKYHEFYPGIFGGSVPVINIDHHASNDNFGTVNVVDSDAASTTLIIYKMFKYWGVSPGPQMATALLTGIYNDTGSLMHSNASLDVFEIAGELVEFGARVSIIAKNLFRTTPISTLKLWGRALENVRVNSEGVTVSVLTWRDFIECGASPDEASGIVDLINSIPGSKYTCLLNEDSGGNVKGSFRTQREDVDLEKLAQNFGGGGHKKASGFTMPGRIHEEVHWKIIPAQELPSGAELPKTV